MDREPAAMLLYAERSSFTNAANSDKFFQADNGYNITGFFAHGRAEGEHMGKIGMGYPEGREYLKLAFNILSPAHLNACLHLSGTPGISLEKKFTYAELGAGFGISVAGWAAQYPHAEFHAVDYNTDQCAWTQKLADMAELDNLFVHACSIGQSLAMPLPFFDVIVLHGMYSWVSDEVRAEIKTFIARFLKPGGCVYVGYNAMPGFKDVEPMRQLVQQCIKADTADDPMPAMNKAFTLLKGMRAAEAPFFQNSPQAGVRLDHWLTDDPRYLAAELLAGQHKAYHFSELQAELAPTGLVFAGTASIVEYLSSRSLPPALAAMMAEADNATMRETLKDLFFNTAFRSDIFVRPKGNFSDSAQVSPSSEEMLKNTRFGLAYVRKPLPEKASRQNFHAVLEKDIFPLLQAAMTAATPSISQLMGALGKPYEEVLEALCIMMALDWVHPVHPAGGSDDLTESRISERVIRFNRSLQAISGEESIMPLLSARSGWIEHREQLEHLCIMAKLRKEPVEGFLLDILMGDRNGEEQEGERSELQKSIAVYLNRSGADLETFLKRHGLVKT